ncbi:MAG: hypothetical protein JNK05_38690 [Myxococcales bacterium]|nr:hypothetical protein [Myxococcales bacterium]
MTDDDIRAALRLALDAPDAPSASDIVAREAIARGERALEVSARARSLWWLCAAAALVAFVSVGLARREHRNSALVTAEALWSL